MMEQSDFANEDQSVATEVLLFPNSVNVLRIL